LYTLLIYYFYYYFIKKKKKIKWIIIITYSVYIINNYYLIFFFNIFKYSVLGYNVDIRGKTLINKNLLVCTYNYQNNASNNLCAPESLKCIDENIPKC